MTGSDLLSSKATGGKREEKRQVEVTLCAQQSPGLLQPAQHTKVKSRPSADPLS